MDNHTARVHFQILDLLLNIFYTRKNFIVLANGHLSGHSAAITQGV
jgi:hypothetical protein